MSTDSEIIRRAQSTPAAFAELYDRHAPSIHRFAARRLGEQTADDLLSETFTVAFEKLDSFDLDRADALPWLFGIVTTLIKKHRRLEARLWRAEQHADRVHLTTEHSDDALEADLAIGRLSGAIRRLSKADRDTILLYAWGDLDYEGVAVALGVPVGTVRSRINRVRRILRAAAGRLATEEVEHGRADVAPQGS
ncbi:RNA polymerase sigma factor [Frondihabitans cladoniiphilus]|uniref:RNA polymerase sigma factor n=1 Tax=Frondihabitans cladoniiphilus TaxID=715785 RepID=A0ABP8VR35_9MICO